MNRSSFLKNSFYITLSGLVKPRLAVSDSQTKELLYNGIELPQEWPPRGLNYNSYDAMQVPYLCNRPNTIPIDTGRQLFVDDFLIDSTNLKRKYHKAKKFIENPVLQPETELEKGNNGLPVACPKDGGVWWDPEDKCFKMWYEAGWTNSMAYATSDDGIHWERPNLGIIPGTNQILPDLRPDSTTVFLDHQATIPEKRFKMFLRPPKYLGYHHGYSMVSPDGIHWSHPKSTGPCGDRSTMFYNPFRKKWVYSIRRDGGLNLPSGTGRARYYKEHSDFLSGADWNTDNVVFWTGADRLDYPDPDIGDKPQLYNLSAVAYESLMLGFHQIHLGPGNRICRKQGTPKITELMTSFSRDGFHWHRPDRNAFIPASRKQGDWERGYIQSVGGICAVVGDQLWFYYSGFRGDQTNTNSEAMLNGMYANGSTGIAVLRRDGFASMYINDDEKGTLITNPVTFKGNYLFVNVNCPAGKLSVEVLNEDFSVIDAYSRGKCEDVAEDSTLKQVTWNGSNDLSPLVGRKVRFRFFLENGHLYSFWVSPSKSGASYGYTGAGGPGITGAKDDVGKEGYKISRPYQLKV